MSAEARPPAPATGWDAVVADATSRLDGGRAAARMLAQVCLAADETAPEHSMMPRPGGLAPGRPTVPVVRAAGAPLLAAMRHATDREARYLRVVGLTFCLWKPQPRPDSDDPLRELHTARDRHFEAVEVARGLADETLVAWCLYHLGLIERKLTRWQPALDALQESADIAIRLLDEGAGEEHPGPFTLLAADWAEPTDVQRRVIACRALKRITLLTPVVGDLASWEANTQRVIELAGPLAATRPSVLAEALSRAGVLARHLGDRDAFREVEERLRRWAEETGTNRVVRGWLSQAAQNAGHLRDFERAYELHRQKADAALDGIDGAPPPGSPPDAYLSIVTILEERGLRSRRIALGNAAYDTATDLWRSRRTADDPEAWHQAGRWLDLAERTWRIDGQNGLVAIELTKARLLVDHPTAPDRLRAADIALWVSENGLNSGTRANAAREAAEWCAPGDLRVRRKLNELIAEATPVQRGKRQAARAQWYRRYAEHLERTGQSVAAVAAAWRNAEDDALAAAGALEVGGMFVDTGTAADAWWVAATACGRPGSAIVDNVAAVRLGRLLNMVHCVAHLLGSASRPRQRSRIAARYGSVFAAAADLANSLGDTRAADLIMEAVRRDRVGLLITDLIRRQDVSETVRATAERVIAARNATPSLPTTENRQPAPKTDTPQQQQHGDDNSGMRALTYMAEAITIRRDRSTAEADEVLGILSPLADGRSLPHATASELLAKRQAHTPAAILQFCPTGTGILPTSPRSRTLYRRLTWIGEDGGTREYLDTVPLKFNPERLDPDKTPYWRQIYEHAAHFLPDPLLKLLRDHDRDRPLRLLVVPTGLFDIAFDALPIDENRHLLDAAAVSIHTSLTTASHLLQRVSHPEDTTSLAVYDTNTLNHTTPEFTVLSECLPPVQELGGLAEFRSRLSAPRGHDYRLLVMAVHGWDDHNGWGQIKQFPDGSTFTAAEAMGFHYPQLCVLASCQSKIRLRESLELAGFPLSFFARGATTVIGSLLDINDGKTSEIMRRFWCHLRAGTDPVHALHAAKLDWLDEDPARRLAGARHWAGLIAFGGAHL
jgi:hypothetical protein